MWAIFGRLFGQRVLEPLSQKDSRSQAHCIHIPSLKMPVCCDCGREAAKKCFSKSQIKKPADKRRCIGCAIKLAPATIPAESDNARVDGSQHACFLCLDDEQTEDSPIVRDCACRGTAGYVHIDCLVELAKSKARQNATVDGKFGASSGGIPVPWIECITCHQEFRKTSRSRIALASAVWSLYPDPSANLKGHLVALHVNSTLQRALGNVNRSRDLTRTRCSLMKAAYTDADSRPDHLITICSGLCYLANSYTADDCEPMEHIIDEASMYASKLGDGDDRKLLEARILTLRCDLAYFRKNFSAARRLCERAIEMYRKCLPGTLELSNSLWRLAEIFNAIQEWEGFLCAARESLTLAKSSLGSEDTFVLERQKRYEALFLCKTKPICRAKILDGNEHFDSHSYADVVKYDGDKQLYAVRRRVAAEKGKRKYAVHFFIPKDVLLSVGTRVTFETKSGKIIKAEASLDGPVYSVKVDGGGTRSGVKSCIAFDPTDPFRIFSVVQFK